MESIGKADKLEQRLQSIEKRLAALEYVLASDVEVSNTPLELDLLLPEADINGLHFNETEVNAVFEKQADGWYHSRDILFISARNVKDDNSRDILTEYLESYDFKNCIRSQLPEEIFGEVLTSDNIEVALPKENEGAKKYNGVPWRYWLEPPYSGSTNFFTLVNSDGGPYYYSASRAYGVAPAFCVR
jgi:hypothetical protein